MKIDDRAGPLSRDKKFELRAATCIPAQPIVGRGDKQIDLASHSVGLPSGVVTRTRAALLEPSIDDGLIVGLVKNCLHGAATKTRESRSPEERDVERWVLEDSIDRRRGLVFNKSIDEAFKQSWLGRRCLETVTAFRKAGETIKATVVTVGASMGVSIFIMGAARLVQKVSGVSGELHLGNHSGGEAVDKLFTSEAPATVISLVGGVSALEEVLFRGIPLAALYLASKYTRKAHAIAPFVGLATATVFALAHNLDSAATAQGIALWGDTVLRTDQLPIPQFAFGLVAWHVASRYGFAYAVLAHCLVNSIGLAATALSTLM